MTLIPEETLQRLLSGCLDLSRRALDQLATAPAIQAASEDLLADYGAFIRSLHDQKRHDTVLADESWEWIWQVKTDLNPIQIYGRLAWINYSLINLL